jgi:hypothetical protein
MGRKKKKHGISKFNLLMIIPGLRKQLKRSLKDGELDASEGVRTIGYVSRRLGRAAKKPYSTYLEKQALSLESLGNLFDIGGQDMAKFELGITVGEITAMLPGLLSEAWAHYSDDKKISVDEGVLMVSSIMAEMANAADDPQVAEFFNAQSAALVALSPFFEEEEAPPEEEEPPAE